ncbi:MAG TPA: hypothetical protein VNQ34_05900 [Xanthobacteraceae bacterium]|nr:hypothetical protein [Xanthobacteraceae bacterium]
MAIIVQLKRKVVAQPSREEKTANKEAREGLQLIRAFQKIRSPIDRKALIAYAKKLAAKKQRR